MIVKRVLLVMFLILTLAMFMGSVSAASNSSLTWTEVENSSYAVQSFTESKGDIPSSVSVSGKKVTDNAYLEVLCKAVVKANTNDKTSVSVVGRGNAPNPSGTAKGTLTKSQYLTVANNIKSFYTDNNRAPNYAESSLGNIRYETLVYMYSKIMNYYRVYDTLPSSISFMYVSGVSSSGAYVDATAPTISNSLPWGTYNAPKTVTLTASDNADTTPTIYYRLNQGAWSSATKTVSLSMGEGRTWLDYYCCDDSGNRAPTYSWYYTIDMDGPSVTASPTGSCYNSSKLVSLIASDNFDASPIIYYTLDGSDPSSSSLRYSSPLNITNTTTLNFLAIDNVGNVGPISSEVYTIGNPVVNVNTGKTYSKIQDALDDVLTLNGHVIQLYSATFLENVVINKNVTLMAASDVVVNALNSDVPVITVNSNGSGSTIQGLVITGATSVYGIHLYQVFNCNIIGNTLTNNNHSIEVSWSKNNNIMHNIITDNDVMGIAIWYSNNTTILGNTIANNQYGIYSGYSNNTTVTENTITGSVYGINPQYSTMDVHFNRISGSSKFGIVNQCNSTVNATNNWWGTSTPSYLNSPTWPSYRDIWNANGTLYYSPYFTSDIGFTLDQIINASLYVKNYVESNHQLPSGVNISGIQVNMPQFLKLATTAVLNINNGMNAVIVLGSVGNASSPIESITVGTMMDTEYINMANNIKNFIDTNGTAPSYVNDTYLDTSIRYESVVYLYSQILNTYNATIGLPDYIPLIPWIAVSNPNGIYNFRTQKVFSSIQAAIDENDTLNEDTIWLGKEPIIENVIVNKSLTITPIYEDENVIVQALNPNLPVFTIGINGTGSIIRNLIINGSTNNAGIYINSSNNTISGNNITGNLNGIYINNSIDNEVLKNIISHNNLDGVFIYEGSNNIVSDNIIEYNGHTGININSSDNNKIHSNILSNNNVDGIYLYNSSTKVNFNKITENSRYGLYNEGNGTIDATNNWWGSNIIDSTDITGNTVNNDSWLILNVTSSCDRSNSNGTYYNYIITADLTHNNQGNDTSSGGNIPDEIPINFSTTLGTINTSAFSRGGKVVAILNGTSANLANVSATLDNKTVTIPVNVTGTTELGIYNIRNPNYRFSTIQAAIDNALDNDTILIENGTYTENIVITKKIIIKPVSGSNVNIQSADGSCAVFTINCGGSGSIITGLIISEATDSYGINLDSASNCNITGNTIINNEIGIYLNNTMDNNISGNTIRDNWIGIYLDKSNNNNVTENTITNTWSGIYIEESNNNLITGNTVTDNSWSGIYIEESNNNLITGNTVTDNGGGIYLLNSNSTVTSENNVINNTMADISQIDRTGIVMASDIYTCGPASLATVMNKLGINATEDELIEFSKTDLTGTTLYGLIQAAQKKNLIAKGLKLNWSELRTNNIVVLTIDGNTHFSIMTQISNNTVYLADTSLGNIEMTLEKFNELYSGNALVVTNNTNDEQLQLDNSKTISTPDTQKIKGKFVWLIPIAAAIVIRTAPVWSKAVIRAASYACRGASTFLRASFRRAPVSSYKNLRFNSIPKTKRISWKKHLQKTPGDMRKLVNAMKKNKKNAVGGTLITALSLTSANSGLIKGYIATSTYNNSSNTSNKKPNNILFYNVTNKSRWDVQYVPIK